jgi:hypothetical protein
MKHIFGSVCCIHTISSTRFCVFLCHCSFFSSSVVNAPLEISTSESPSPSSSYPGSFSVSAPGTRPVSGSIQRISRVSYTDFLTTSLALYIEAFLTTLYTNLKLFNLLGLVFWYGFGAAAVHFAVWLGQESIL